MEVPFYLPMKLLTKKNPIMLEQNGPKKKIIINAQKKTPPTPNYK